MRNVAMQYVANREKPFLQQSIICEQFCKLKKKRLRRYDALQTGIFVQRIERTGFFA
jgi:hypothetical protein